MVLRAHDVLDAVIGVALGIAIETLVEGQIDGNAPCRGRVGVTDNVDARAAVQPVGTGAADEHVIVIAAVNEVVAGATVQEVIAVEAVDGIRKGGADQQVVAIGADQRQAGGRRRRWRRRQRLLRLGQILRLIDTTFHCTFLFEEGCDVEGADLLRMCTLSSGSPHNGFEEGLGPV